MTPSQESALFMYELGQTISHWAYLEADLAVLVAAAVSRDDKHTVQVGFYAIENFRSKLAYCDNILNERFHEVPNFSRWEEVRTRIEAISRKRNRLAHQTVMVSTGGEVGRRTGILDWKAQIHNSPKLAPKPSRKTKGLPDGTLFVRDLAQITLEMKAVTYAIRNIRCLVLGEPPAYDINLEKPENAPTIAVLFKRFKATVMAEEESH